MRGLVIVMVFGLGCAVALIASAAYLNRPHYQRPTEQQTATNNAQGDKESFNYDAANLEISRSNLHAQWIVAIGTLLVFVLTLVALVVSQYYSAKGLKASVRNERAYIMLKAVEIKEPGMAETKRTIHWSFENFGRGPGIVIEVAHSTELIDASSEIPSPDTIKDHARAGAYHALASGGTMFTSDRNTNLVGAIHPCPSDEIQGTAWASIKNGTKQLLFCGSVTYRSMSDGGYYRRYFTAIWNPNHDTSGRGSFYIHNSPGYNDEVELTEIEATKDRRHKEKFEA